MSDLHTTRVGDGPIDYVFCHGLFGRGRNWTGVARRLQPAASLLVDLPNHGDSPWTDRFSYPAMAEAVAGLLGEIAAAGTTPHAPTPAPPAANGGPAPISGGSGLTLVGHSMGGRVAMLTALTYPELVGRLVVVDVAPTAMPGMSLGLYAQALQALGPTELGNRQTADQALAPVVTDPRVRAFLLTGYRFSAEEPDWHFNLAVLARDLGRIMDWPNPGPAEPYPGPVLWLAGAESPYITPASYPAMRRLFPHYRLETIAGAGHWVQADAPDAFVEALNRFVGQTLV